MTIHPVILLGLAFLNIFAVLILGACPTTAILFLLHTVLCFLAGLRPLTYLKVILLAGLFSLSLFILNYLYATVDLAMYNFARAILLTTLSLSAGLIIDFERLLLFLMSKKILPPSIGYPIFAAINALEHLREEKKRLDHLARIRGLNHFRYQLHQIMPLLVFALRHSQRAATAMIARGLSDQKVFYYDYRIPNRDFKIGVVVFLAQIMTLIIAPTI
ncbi:MAG: hypothetical protein A2X86_08000 [Bdellovibrionales bacterium GWA2_49_15]|nr:MAG: hypothetical protein A2X86_08000 [Bdellovibrionales bacterium GWA2_49_15]HAZ11779.1 hypothetical protein [Bdellovibrionales bacterium]